MSYFLKDNVCDLWKKLLKIVRVATGAAFVAMPKMKQMCSRMTMLTEIATHPSQ